MLAHGILEVQAGTHVLWSQWFLAFLPAALLSIVIIWLSIRWFYPITNYELMVVQQALNAGTQAVGPWSQQERKAFLWLLLAITLWALDFLHHLNPAMIAISIGLILVLPKAGVLDSTSIRQVNFTVVLFIGGALAMGKVLAETQVLDILVDSLVAWLAPIMSNAWQGAVILYWSNFFFRFLLGTELTTVSTALPLWLKAAEAYGYNPACIGLIWAFAGAGKLFIYQSSVLVMGYAYGFFDSRDIFKIGAILGGFFIGSCFNLQVVSNEITCPNCRLPTGFGVLGFSKRPWITNFNCITRQETQLIHERVEVRE